jgi:hypothetical protein
MSTGRNFKKILEKMGGSEKAKPHSTKEGRVASGTRRIIRIIEKQKPKTAQPRPKWPDLKRPSRPKWSRPKGELRPLRAKKAGGGIAKIIGKKAVDWIKKNRKTIRKEIYSPEGKKKTKDMLDNLKKKYGDLTLGPKKAKGGRAGYNIGGRANLLEEMGRIDARKHPDAADRAEKRRVIGELNKGYKSGGAVLKGKKVGCQIK